MSNFQYPTRTVANMAEKANSRIAESAGLPWNSHKAIKDVNGITDMKEAIHRSGLDWNVTKEPTYIKEPNGDWVPSGSFSVVRASDRKILAPSVGPDYQPIQNLYRFDWFQNYLNSGAVSLTHAGSLRDGEKTVIIARLNGDNASREIIKGDEVAKYLLIKDSFDGKSALSVLLMAVRLVCGNGAISTEKAGSWRIKHNNVTTIKMDAIRDDVHRADDNLNKFVEHYKLLAHKPLPKAQAVQDYIKEVFNLKPMENKKTGVMELSTKARNIVANIENRLETGAGSDIPGVRGTYWGLYNAVTEYLNWERGHNVDTRLDGLWFGQSAKTANEALTLALAA